jgi:hypothetical protein
MTGVNREIPPKLVYFGGPYQAAAQGVAPPRYEQQVPFPIADPVVYIRERLAEGCSYVILPNELAARVIARETELELDAEMLRAEIEALQRMRHAALKERK